MIQKYVIENTPIKSITLLFSKKEHFCIERIILSTPSVDSQEIAGKLYENADYGDCRQIKSVASQIQSYFNHEPYRFSLDYLNLKQCSDFQKKVLLEEFKSPYGSFNTYKELAIRIGDENSSRAIGNALRRNPFPIIIPCHRTVKANLEIGGYNGIVGENSFKSILLKHEGHQIKNNKIMLR